MRCTGAARLQTEWKYTKFSVNQTYQKICSHLWWLRLARLWSITNGLSFFSSFFVLWIKGYSSSNKRNIYNQYEISEVDHHEKYWVRFFILDRLSTFIFYQHSVKVELRSYFLARSSQLDFFILVIDFSPVYMASHFSFHNRKKIIFFLFSSTRKGKSRDWKTREKN